MNRYTLIIILWLLFFNSAMYSQHDNNWYFGRWAGINFSSGSPVAVTDNAFSTTEGTSVMSDHNGMLLFYTNGVRVYNKNHQIMQNGTGLAGDTSTSQAAVIVPKPGQMGWFYIFTVDNEGGADGLQYSEVDMSQNNGLGAVVVKNVPLITPVIEKLNATFHSNGNDIWITVHHWGSNAFYSFLVTAAGVNPIPVISAVGPSVEGASNSGRYAGWMSISPDGSKLAMASRNLGAELFDFDTSTGVVSNHVTLSTGLLFYGVAFSPSSKLLYVSAENRLSQFNIAAPDIAGSEVILTTSTAPGPLQLGPDGKIYSITRLLHPFLSVINDPDRVGTGCNFNVDQVDLAGKQTFQGLPVFLNSPFYLRGINTVADCSGSQVSFTADAILTPDAVDWDFGDGNTSTVINPVHTYAAAGTYTVKIKARRGYFTRYYNQTVTVTISAQPIANQPQTLIKCDENNNGQAQFNLRLQDATILGTQSPAVYGVSYHASLADAEAGSNALPDSYTNMQNPQIIYARVLSAQGTGCFAVTSFELSVRQKPILVMDDLYTFCTGSTMPLSAPTGFDAYLWSTGETTQTIQAGAGQYTLTVFKDYNGVLCSTSATVTVIKSGAPVIKIIDTSDWTDHNNSIHVIAEGNGTFLYSLDSVTYQSSPVFSGLEPGVYNVYVKDDNGCGEAVQEVALLMYPKYFTPNGDSFHETWHIKFGQHEPELVVYIFDRYGKLLTSFKGSSPGWDGKYNGRDLPSTDYWFVAVRQNGKKYKGHFSMLR